MDVAREDRKGDAGHRWAYRRDATEDAKEDAKEDEDSGGQKMDVGFDLDLDGREKREEEEDWTVEGGGWSSGPSRSPGT